MDTGTWPYDLLSLEEWDALPRDNSRHFELAEGVLLVVPKPPPAHQRAMARLSRWFDEQLPRDVVAVPSVEVLIDSVPPCTVRAPDVVIIPTERCQEYQKRLDAGDLRLAVEIVSPGTGRTDRVFKPIEYAKVGIPHYWVVELDEPVTLTAFSLVAGRYKQIAQGIGKIEVPEPFPVTIDLATLINP